MKALLSMYKVLSQVQAFVTEQNKFIYAPSYHKFNMVNVCDLSARLLWPLVWPGYFLGLIGADFAQCKFCSMHFCLPEDYNKETLPPTFDGKPLEVHSGLHLNLVGFQLLKLRAH